MESVDSPLPSPPLPSLPRAKFDQAGSSRLAELGEASATELGTQNAPGKAPVRAQRRIIDTYEAIFFITNVDCVVCNTNYNYVCCLYEAIIITDINCVVCKYNAVWLLLFMLPLFQTFIIDYNYVCSLVG